MNNRNKGSAYEDTAASFLGSEGYRVLERNYLRKTGEIDLIALSPDNVLVFVEVKYRKTGRYGEPYEAVTPAKQQRIYRTAEWYLKETGRSFSSHCRFDVISIRGEAITHIKNAFGGF